MAGFSSLEIGKRALLAQRFGIEVTSNNIANVNTPGYSRRSATLSETDSILSKGNYFGTGVQADTLRSFRDEYYDREIRSTNSRLSAFEEDEKMFQKIEAILNEPSDMGLTEYVTDFFTAFDDLSLKPENVGLRETLLGNAQTLVERLHTTSSQMTETRAELNSKINMNVDKVNTLVEEIAKLNKSIANSAASANSDNNSYVDEREKKLEELSSIIDVQVSFEQNGLANVFANGMNLITGETVNRLKASEIVNPATGERDIQISHYDPSKGLTQQITPQSGELYSNLKHYNTTLDPNETGNGFSVAKQLDEFAGALVSKVNSLTQKGFGLDDTYAVSPGRAFFDPIVGKATAANIAISADIKDNPRDIPMSGSPGAPGNSEIARAISRIQQDKNFLNNQTPVEYYTTFLGKVASASLEAVNGLSAANLVSDQLNTQRESVIGVNMDEEAINLIKFQKAFEAASRVVNTTNELLATIINLGK